jgi:hypothetical protein
MRTAAQTTTTTESASTTVGTDRLRTLPTLPPLQRRSGQERILVWRLCVERKVGARLKQPPAGLYYDAFLLRGKLLCVDMTDGTQAAPTTTELVLARLFPGYSQPLGKIGVAISACLGGGFAAIPQTGLPTGPVTALRLASVRRKDLAAIQSGCTRPQRAGSLGPGGTGKFSLFGQLTKGQGVGVAMNCGGGGQPSPYAQVPPAVVEGAVKVAEFALKAVLVAGISEATRRAVNEMVSDPFAGPDAALAAAETERGKAGKALAELIALESANPTQNEITMATNYASTQYQKGDAAYDKAREAARRAEAAQAAGNTAARDEALEEEAKLSAEAIEDFKKAEAARDEAEKKAKNQPEGNRPGVGPDGNSTAGCARGASQLAECSRLGWKTGPCLDLLRRMQGCVSVALIQPEGPEGLACTPPTYSSSQLTDSLVRAIACGKKKPIEGGPCSRGPLAVGGSSEQVKGGGRVCDPRITDPCPPTPNPVNVQYTMGVCPAKGGWLPYVLCARPVPPPRPPR